MSASQINGENTEMADLQKVHSYLKEQVEKISATVPDLRITLIARNMVQPGFDFIVSEDDPVWLSDLINKAKARLETLKANPS